MGKQCMKKAQGLTLNTIVIAALVLVVLLIALAILGRTSGKTLPFFDKQTECSSRSGVCETEAKCVNTTIYGLGCEKDKDGKDTGKVCCIKSG